MARNTEKSMARAFGRRAAQVVLVGAMAATPLALGTGLAHADTDWDELAQCESGGDWSINTGNGFGGGLQFTDSTWESFGGSGNPEDASRSEQIAVAERVKAEQGMNAWPTCSDKTGNTDDSPNSGSSGSSESSSESSEAAPAAEDDATEAAAEAPAEPAAPAASGEHVVAAGDTLSEIASSNGTTVPDLAARNALADPDTIVPGQKLALA